MVCFLFLVAPVFLLAGCAEKAPAPVGNEEPSLLRITIRVPGERVARGVMFRPPGQGRFPGLVLVHGDFGLTKWVEDEARRLAKQGYVVYAADLYRGEVVKDVMDAHIMDRGLPQERVLADLDAAVKHLIETGGARPDALGIVGFDMGGGYALDAALRDDRLHAVVVCYGRLTTDPALLKALNASVLGIFAGQDEGIPPETIERFRMAMDKAGKRVAGIHVYPACQAGFLETGQGESAQARADAWRKIEEYLAAELKR
jgi:carboxymethylenebutenolidase